MVCNPAIAPFLKVSVAIRIIVGPGMEATEKPMANASENVTKVSLEPFPLSVNWLVYFGRAYWYQYWGCVPKEFDPWVKSYVS